MRTVQLKDFSGVLKDFSKGTLEQQRKAVISGVARSLPALAEASPVDTGLYAASWGMNVTETSVLVGNYAPYAAIIEYGARPFTPPIGPLLGWAKRVLGSSSQPPNYESKVWALAKYTQQKIAKYGMQPRHIMENMIPTIIENIEKEFKNVK